MIKTFEQFNVNDPYDEEDWDDVNFIDVTPITNNTTINIGDIIYYHYRSNGNPIIMGEVTHIVKSPFGGERCYILLKGQETKQMWRQQLIGCGAQIKNN